MSAGDATADVLAGHAAGRGRDRRPGGGLAAVLSGDEAHAYRQTPPEAAETNVRTVCSAALSLSVAPVIRASSRVAAT